ncbi:uncharacterized protein OCT59_016424 [Rhizophagus irregularis]|uniref:uncharacterized protein n=1 Tax=Rhizophagus irregularis TaxID=588596 RepID=UPI00331EF4AC|nr:hypothetical protein OCT59_016424 [Rhizophagus irregularis]
MDAYKESQLTLEKSYVDKIILIEKGQNGVCVIICMIVIVGLLFVQITALIVDIINVPRKGLANEEIDFLFGIVVESSLARSNSLQRKSDATAITKKVMITPLKIGVAILSMM